MSPGQDYGHASWMSRPLPFKSGKARFKSAGAPAANNTGYSIRFSCRKTVAWNAGFAADAGVHGNALTHSQEWYLSIPLRKIVDKLPNAGILE